MRTATLTFAIAVSAPFSALAEGFPADRIVAAATGDWNRDGSPDLVVIAAGTADRDEDNGIYVYLTDPDETRLKLKLAAPDKIWGSLDMFGQEPGVSALPNGSIQLTSQNSAVGRDRWSQSLTLAYRSDAFVVAGYSYSSYDTLDNGNTSKCDLNVLTGKGTANGKSITVKGQSIPFESWTDELGQKACGFEAR